MVPTYSTGDHCPQAHSARELAEWKRRKIELLKQQMDNGTYSDRILKAVLSESRYLWFGNRRIAPTQNCTHEIKIFFMMLILG